MGDGGKTPGTAGVNGADGRGWRPDATERLPIARALQLEPQDTSRGAIVIMKRSGRIKAAAMAVAAAASVTVGGIAAGSATRAAHAATPKRGGSVTLRLATGLRRLPPHPPKGLGPPPVPLPWILGVVCNTASIARYGTGRR